MNEKQPKSVIARYLQELEKLIGSEDSEGNYAYRGQENADWGVESGAFRRLKEKTNPSKEDFISYHEDELLEPARMDGHGIEEGHELSDLELLAKLQHHGAATCLIDFTRNFLVAMWFACQPHKDKEKDKNGKIFILNTSDEGKFLSLEKKDLEEKVKPILTFQTRDEVNLSKDAVIFPISTRSWWHWSPHGVEQRILKQDSLFIFGQPKIEDTYLEEIKIKYGHKEKILEELERLGVAERTLFKDLPGFADSHGYNKPLPPRYETPNYYLRKGNEAWQRDDFEDAMANYNRAIKLKPDYAVNYINRGRFKLFRDDKPGAIGDLDQAIKLKPDYIDAYNTRGIVKVESNNHKGAIDDFNRAIELKPDFAKAYSNRGFVKAELGDHTGAINDFNRAIELEPDFAEAYYNRGDSNRSLDSHSDAIADYDRTIKLKPNLAKAYNKRGLAKYNSDKHSDSEAIADYDKAIKHKPDFAEAYKNRGIIKSDLGNHRSAIADYDRAIELEPDLAEAYYNRGNVNRSLGRDSEAIADYDKAIKHKPDYAKAYYNRGLAHDSLGKKRKARQGFSKAQKLAKQSGDDQLVGLISKALSKLDNGNNNKS